MRYYKIKNWKKFQHYKDRCPPWIKLHWEMLQSHDWVLLSNDSRLYAVVCMLIASRHDGYVPDDPEYIKRVAYLNEQPDLSPLVEVGFLEPVDNKEDTKDLQANDSRCKQTQANDSRCNQTQANDTTETETETEAEESETPPADIDTDVDTDVEKEIPDDVLQLAFQTYRHMPGAISQWYEWYPPRWIPEAIKITGKRCKTNPAYTKAILESWREQGGIDIDTDSNEFIPPGHFKHTDGRILPEGHFKEKKG